uniref:Uncharacterized protein n=1 Tax=Meleagris gallopavo TaxID=9103 RepID=A0A803YIR6_MELGA
MKKEISHFIQDPNLQTHFLTRSIESVLMWLRKMQCYTAMSMTREEQVVLEGERAHQLMGTLVQAMHLGNWKGWALGAFLFTLI